MKRGQVQHAFSFMIFILVAGFIIIIGYGMITKWMGNQCEAEMIVFEEKITGLFDKYDDYGSLHKEALRLPCGSEIICFVDAEIEDWTGLPRHDLIEGNSNMLEVLRTSKETNETVFLVREGYLMPAGNSQKVQIDPSANPQRTLCVKARGANANLIFEGQGKGTLVREG